VPLRFGWNDDIDGTVVTMMSLIARLKGVQFETQSAIR